MAKSIQAQAASIIRKHLKNNGIKATVKSSGGFMAAAVEINTCDLLPATAKLISSYLEQFSIGRFEYISFVTFKNNFSDELKQAAWSWTRENFGGLEDSPKPLSKVCDYDDTLALRNTLNNDKSSFWNTLKSKKTIKVQAA